MLVALSLKTSFKQTKEWQTTNVAPKQYSQCPVVGTHLHTTASIARIQEMLECLKDRKPMVDTQLTHFIIAHKQCK